MAKKCKTCVHLDDASDCLMISSINNHKNPESLASTWDYDGWSSGLTIKDPNKFYCYHWTKKETK